MITLNTSNEDQDLYALSVYMHHCINVCKMGLRHEGHINIGMYTFKAFKNSTEIERWYDINDRVFQFSHKELSNFIRNYTPIRQRPY